MIANRVDGIAAVNEDKKMRNIARALNDAEIPVLTYGTFRIMFKIGVQPRIDKFHVGGIGKGFHDGRIMDIRELLSAGFSASHGNTGNDKSVRCDMHPVSCVSAQAVVAAVFLFIHFTKRDGTALSPVPEYP